MEIDYNWSFISSLFEGVKPFEDSIKVVESDREVKFKSKELVLFLYDRWTLEKGRLPDLRFQNLNIETGIRQSVNGFLIGSEFLGLLIGPTGCGKTHEILNVAKTQFTVFIDAKSYPASNEPNDVSLSALKQSFESTTSTWIKLNQDLAKLRTIAYAFVLSRMLFLRYLKEKYSALTPAQFLIHQLFNSQAIQNCFFSLAALSDEKLFSIRNQFIDFRCLFCVDEAHVLVEHLGNSIISSTAGIHVQQNGDVIENSRRGTLSVLLHAIKEGQFSRKVLFAGTSSKLRNIDNFGTFETKPVAPVFLNQFKAWNSVMALKYVSSLVDIPQSQLKEILVDNYRPRILENFVYDLFSIGINDNASPEIMNERVSNRSNLVTISAILKESYAAVIHRFTRVSIAPLAQTIRNISHTEIMLKLLLSSMMTSKEGPINCQLDKHQINFFTDTIGSIYLISGLGGYSFYEGYVIDQFVALFEQELKEYNLWSALNLLKNIVGLEGRKTSAKGTPFEAVVLADLVKLNDRSLSKVLSEFGVTITAADLHLPSVESKLDDAAIISQRPLNVFLRPSNLFRPDILGFLSNQVCVSFGIKLYTSRISSPVHDDNLESTDPDLFFFKSGNVTDKRKRNQWKKSCKANPFISSVRFLIELPEPVSTVSTEAVHRVENGKETVIVVITRHNMRKLLSDDVALLVDFITK